GLDNFEKMVNVEVTRVEHTWGGLRTFSQDREPVVGFAPESVDGSGGFFWLAGQGGYGIQTSPALSALAAKLVLQQTLNESESELAALLNPVRFV
nr:FAD-dependent oxidoreductase [Granulosicoccus sp.]